jgi:hypothetical protein
LSEWIRERKRIPPRADAKATDELPDFALQKTGYPKLRSSLGIWERIRGRGRTRA